MTRVFLMMLGAFALSACHSTIPNPNPAQRLDPNSDFSTSPCMIGIYGDGTDMFVAITGSPNGDRYSFSDGRIGSVEESSAVECGSDSVLVDKTQVWDAIPIRVTDTRFVAGDVLLVGRLLEPAGADKDTPLIAYAHGSEDTGWIGTFRDPYQMVGRGISVFVYDKRGTGLSEGKYSQNFPQLAEDLVAASNEAKRLAQNRFGRFGLVGLSQGGWIAPLAAERAEADFIAIGYGLVADIREEDAAQVQKELRDRGYDDVLVIAREITDVTAQVASSDYVEGLSELADIQRRYSSEEWYPHIRGGYTGVFLNTSTDELRERGVPQFNDLNIDWSLNPLTVLADVSVPQLWVLAGEDREAPIDLTLDRLQTLRRSGSEIAIQVFPDTDHGMWEYREAADGTRDYLRVTSGYYDLIADYIKGELNPSYGRARVIAAD